MSAFEEAGLMPELIRAVEDMGWLYAPVLHQKRPLPEVSWILAASKGTSRADIGKFVLFEFSCIGDCLLGYSDLTRLWQ